MVDQAEETFWAVFKVLIDHTDRFLFSMLMEKKEDKKDGMLLPDTDLEKIKLKYFCLDQGKNRNGSLMNE